MALDESVGRRARTKSPAVRDRTETLAPVLVVAGAVLLSIVVHYVLALQQKAPWLMGDELRYADMAKSFLAEGRLLVRDQLSSFATAYPALIAPAWAAADVEQAYKLAKGINVLLMTCSAGVVFLWARRLTPTAYALIAAGLVLLMPTFAYTGMLMMENAALPAFLLAGYVMARALERPSVAWQLAVFMAIGLAALFRIQGVSLAIVYTSAIVLFAIFEWRAGAGSVLSALRRFSATLGIVVLGSLGYVAYKLLSGASLASGLGAYDTVSEVDYDLRAVARWAVWHAGELALSVGFIPAVALVLLIAIALRRGSSPTLADRAFVAVAAAMTFWFVLQAAAFASRFSERIEERYMVYAAPILFIALALWLARALPRPTVATLATTVAAGLLVLTIPFERFFNVAIYADSFGLVPMLRLSDHFGGDLTKVRLAVVGGAALAGVALLTLSARAGRVLFPAAVAVFLLLSAYTVYGAVEVQSAGARSASAAPDPSWVDRIVGRSGRVGLIVTAALTPNPHLLWQTEFWNRSVRGVYAFGTDPALTFGGEPITLAANGHLVSSAESGPQSIDEPYVLAEPNLGILGDVIAKSGPLALIAVKQPVRIAYAVDGVHTDGWSGSQATLSQYAPLPGGARRVRVKLSREGWRGPDAPGRATVTVGPLRMTKAGPTLARVTATRRWTAHSGQTRTFVLRVPSSPFQLRVRVAPTFSPAQFGFADSRQLGVQLAIEASPAGE